MEDCIFCKIVAGEIPCFKTYEDDLFLGFLDIKPLNKGNSLLIPKKHYRWVNDVPEFGEYWEAARKLALKTAEIVQPESTSYLTLGYEVPHAHIRIIPRFENDGHDDGIQLSAVKKISMEEMKALSEEILQL
jgi:histidine triad (HIT) family protein